MEGTQVHWAEKQVEDKEWRGGIIPPSLPATGGKWTQKSGYLFISDIYL